MTDGAPRARLLSIGSELLAGETVDSNAAFLARRLVGLGIAPTNVQQLPDEQETIAQRTRRNPYWYFRMYGSVKQVGNDVDDQTFYGQMRTEKAYGANPPTGIKGAGTSGSAKRATTTRSRTICPGPRAHRRASS